MRIPSYKRQKAIRAAGGYDLNSFLKNERIQIARLFVNYNLKAFFAPPPQPKTLKHFKRDAARSKLRPSFEQGKNHMAINFIKPTRANIDKVKRKLQAARLKNETKITLTDACWLNVVVAALLELGVKHAHRPTFAPYLVAAGEPEGDTSHDNAVIVCAYGASNDIQMLSLERIDEVNQSFGKDPNPPVFDEDTNPAPEPDI